MKFADRGPLFNPNPKPDPKPDLDAILHNLGLPEAPEGSEQYSDPSEWPAWTDVAFWPTRPVAPATVAIRGDVA